MMLWLSGHMHATSTISPEISPVPSLQKGLKTGMYYLRTRAAADAIKFTVDQQVRACSCRVFRVVRLCSGSFEVGVGAGSAPA
jgi:hypothetical protein